MIVDVLVFIGGAVTAIAALFFADSIVNSYKKIKYVRKKRLENDGRPDVFGLYVPLIQIEQDWDDKIFRAYAAKEGSREPKRDYDTYGLASHPMDAVFDLLVNLREASEREREEARKKRKAAKR